ncbi:hypothetical protein HUJ04_005326 [Dendroctonus ponderosae]|nr:hypothetical protein HUJ04_005326 [Dendroctonus ponderosae]
MVEESVIAKKVGRAQNATFPKETVALPTALDTGNASVDFASASQDGKVFVQYYVPVTVSMVEESVIAKKVGRAQNATFPKETVALPTALDTGNASVDFASASQDGKVKFVKKQIAKIPTVQNMELA